MTKIMKAMTGGVYLCMTANNLYSQEPLKEQLEQAKQAFVALGGGLHCAVRNFTGTNNKIFYIYSLPTDPTDKVLKEIPNLPFDFGLQIHSSSNHATAMKELSLINNLRMLSFSGGGVSFAGVNEGKGFKNLTHLTLASTTVNDAELQNVAKLKHLKSLRIFASEGNHGKITDLGLMEIAKHVNLTEFGDYGYDAVTDNLLKEISKLKNLKTFHTSIGTRVTNAGLKELANLENLTDLSLQSTQVTCEGIEELAKLKMLTSLVLNATKVNDEGLRVIAKLNNLRELNLGGTMVTDAGINEITRLKKLTKLIIGNTKITDAGLKEIAQFENLTEIDLTGLPVTDEGIQQLANLTHLKIVKLNSTKVTTEGRRELQKKLPKCRL